MGRHVSTKSAHVSFDTGNSPSNPELQFYGLNAKLRQFQFQNDGDGWLEDDDGWCKIDDDWCEEDEDDDDNDDDVDDFNDHDDDY